MPYYVFAIGGTGARCLESLVYLCAMGLGPDQPLHPILVDPDEGNGNLNRTIELIVRYKKIREQIKNPSKNDFFKTEIIYDDAQSKADSSVQIPNRYNPNSGLVTGQNTLAHFIQYNTVLTNDGTKHLADLLFSPDELDMDMAAGFRGIPSIGSILMTNVNKQKFWDVITSELKSNSNSRVFVFASVFGGTGASGYPVISQLLKNKAPATKVGGSLILPYFKLKDPKNLTIHKDRIMPDSNSFMVNAKTACQYYANSFNGNDSNYVLGDHFDNCKQYENYAVGSRDQKNDSHVIELFAAYAALDFWAKEGDNFKRFYKIIVSNPVDKNKDTHILETDLPTEIPQSYPFERFALLYHYINNLYHLIDNQSIKTLDKIAWLRGLRVADEKVRGKMLVDEKDSIKPLKEFTDSFKTWINMIHTNDRKLEMIDSNLNLDSLLVKDRNRYRNFNINFIDVKSYNVAKDQQNIVGSILQVLSRAKLTKGGR